MSLIRFRRTPESTRLAVLRIMVAIVFMAAGLAKMVVPEFVAAFENQLRAVQFPFIKYVSLLVPILELIIGYSLLIGKFTRFWSGVAIAMMAVAIYVQLQITDPALFPLQPLKPVVPVVMVGLLTILLVMGAGSWSKDLDIFEK